MISTSHTTPAGYSGKWKKGIIAAAAAMVLAVPANTAVAGDDGIARSATGKRYGVTTLSANYLREEPWLKVKTPDPYTAWCVDSGVKKMSLEEMEDYIATEKIICTADYSTIWTKPVRTVRGRPDVRKPACRKTGNTGESDKGLQKICDIVSGDLIPYSGKTVKGCYEVRLVTGETGYVPVPDASIFDTWIRRCYPSAENIIGTAMRFIGVPYLWGGTSIKGVDCSGLTKMVWLLNGVLLPRNASQQARVGLPVRVDADTDRFPADSPENFTASGAFREEMLKRISDLRPGDMIFFGTPAHSASVSCGSSETGSGGISGKEKITHVGIYIGDGRFIHASKLVRINSLVPGEPDFYELSGKMIKARRIIGSTASDGIVSISDSPAYFPQEY